MNNLLILPILIPLMTGILLIFFREQIRIQRLLSVISFLMSIGASIYLLQKINNQGIITLEIGGWRAPFGVILVGDMLAILLVLSSYVVSLASLLYAFSSIDKEREKYYFYPFLQFLLVGVSGSFLTGDLFNLFVFFEVMLISSYVLIVLGGTAEQLRESIKYILINIVSSILFLSAISYLYAVIGTLNMGDLSLRVAIAGQDGILTVIAALFLIVFGLKAGLFLYYWLPGSYSAPPTAIAAIFAALLTKVGIYAMMRLFTLIFYHEPSFTHQLIAYLSALTMILGVIGALAYRDVKKILAYNVIVAVGFISFGFSIMSTVALAGTLFYFIHDMIIKAVLFLLGGAIISITGTSDLRKMGGLIKDYPSLGWMFFIAALALAGVPPLSGFLGKLMIVQSGLEAGSLHTSFYWLTGISLLSSLLVLYSIIKIFMHGFWGESKRPATEEKSSTRGIILPCALLVALSIIYGVASELAYPYIWLAAEALMDPSLYIEAILQE